MPKSNQEHVQLWISKWLAKAGVLTDFTASLLLGDGSSRSFYRVTTPTKNYILISDPEWTQTQDYPTHQAYLEKLGIPVPEFYCADSKQGILLMQDLGDELLQVRLGNNPNEMLHWLLKATALLADLHGKTFPTAADIPAAKRSFDEKKYFAELQFTFEYLHQKLLNQSSISSTQEKEIQNFCSSISRFSPCVFSHRDYHCRNLLVYNEALVMIDFQDARLGAPHYDLASLIYDAYQPLNDSQRVTLIETYKSQILKYPIFEKINWNSFETDLKRIAFQRTLKAAGSFASFFIRYGKTTHWPYLLPALNSALQLQENGFGVGPQVIDIEKWIALISQLKIQ